MLNPGELHEVLDHRESVQNANIDICFQEHEPVVARFRSGLGRNLKGLDRIRGLAKCFCPLAERVGPTAKRICAHAIDTDALPDNRSYITTFELARPDPFVTEATGLHNLHAISETLLNDVQAPASQITLSDFVSGRREAERNPLKDDNGAPLDAKGIQENNHAQMLVLQQRLLHEIDNFLDGYEMSYRMVLS